MYATAGDLKLPTVKSGLRALFEKPGTDRQAALVRLIAGIPAVRKPDQGMGASRRFRKASTSACPASAVVRATPSVRQSVTARPG